MEFSIIFILSAGMVSAFNPCGIALLPSYVSYLIGGESKKTSFPSALGQGIALGTSMTLGFLTVFVLMGLALTFVGKQLTEAVPWFSFAIAVLVALLGAGMLFGKHLSIKSFSIQIKQGKLSIYFYGVGYALASLGCTLPAFLMVLSQSLVERDILGVITKFVIYSAGMGLVVTAITIISLISKQYANRFLEKYIPVIEKLAALIIFVSGIYLVYYWTLGAGGVLL
jgi:cytochrome c-type biogenesis protein